LPRSATNTYFPQTVTLISLTKSDDRVRQTIAEHKTTIDSIRALPQKAAGQHGGAEAGDAKVTINNLLIGCGFGRRLEVDGVVPVRIAAHVKGRRGNIRQEPQRSGLWWPAS
jgi:hypothetical protein